jgi:hypothetical protein
VRQTGFIRSDLLRSHDQIETYCQVTDRSSEQVIVRI